MAGPGKGLASVTRMAVLRCRGRLLQKSGRRVCAAGITEHEDRPKGKSVVTWQSSQFTSNDADFPDARLGTMNSAVVPAHRRIANAIRHPAVLDSRRAGWTACVWLAKHPLLAFTEVLFVQFDGLRNRLGELACDLILNALTHLLELRRYDPFDQNQVVSVVGLDGLAQFSRGQAEGSDFEIRQNDTTGVRAYLPSVIR